MSTKKMTAEEKMVWAKVQMLIKQPFFGSLLCVLPWEESKEIPTMATDGRKVLWNRDFVDGISKEEVMFVQCHEIMHCAFRHIPRMRSRDRMIWNKATDYVINQLLKEEGIGSMPSFVLYDKALYDEGAGNPEKIYELLKDREDSSSSGESHDVLLDGPSDPAERAQMEADMRVAVSQAANQAKAVGKLSSNLARFVQNFTKPRVDWKTIVRQFAIEQAKDEQSYSKPNRHMMALADDEGLLFPGYDGERLGEIVFAVDMSGSIGQKEVNAFGGAGKELHEDYHPEKMHVLFFDDGITGHDEFDADDTFVMNPRGGGGTAFSPIFKYIKDKGINAVGVIVLTDLCCYDYGPAPEYPVMWLSTSPDDSSWNQNVPFGRVVPMQLD